MPAKCDAYRDVLRLTAKARKAGMLQHHKGDLIRHDKRDLKGYCGPYLWAVRESGTHLLTPEGACHGINHSKAWEAIARGEVGRAQIYYSKDGRQPRRVSGSVPKQLAAKWERACKHRYNLWTGEPLGWARR